MQLLGKFNKIISWRPPESRRHLPSPPRKSWIRHWLAHKNGKSAVSLGVLDLKSKSHTLINLNLKL